MHSLFNSFRENIWDKGCRGLNIALLAALFVVPGFAKAQPTLESKLKMPATTVAATGQYGVVSSTTTGRHLANEVFFGNVYPDDEIEAIVSTQHDDRLGYSAFIVGKNGKKASISISDKLPAQANRLSRWNSSGLFRSIPGANPGDLDRVVAGLEDGFRIFKFNENNGLYEVDKSLVDYGEPNTP
ncbi:MAG: hypothetical protein U9P14_06840, partial [Gemmatimonadota bacterium]|nr:hypothetical protein [Gemmatimonadota bacterium]